MRPASRGVIGSCSSTSIDPSGRLEELDDFGVKALRGSRVGYEAVVP